MKAVGEAAMQRSAGRVLSAEETASAKALRQKQVSQVQKRAWLHSFKHPFKRQLVNIPSKSHTPYWRLWESMLHSRGGGCRNTAQ